MRNDLSLRLFAEPAPRFGRAPWTPERSGEDGGGRGPLAIGCRTGWEDDRGFPAWAGGGATRGISTAGA
jgi:hypothetical protein